MGRNFFEHPLVLVVLVLLIVVVFGAKRLPDAARSLGRSMRIFKSEVREMKDDGKPTSSSAAGTPGRPLEGRVVGEDGFGQAAATDARVEERGDSVHDSVHDAQRRGA